MGFKHILVGTDFSDDSTAALSKTRELAVATGAKVTLMHSYPLVVYGAYPGPVTPVPPSKEQLVELKHRLEKDLERLRGEHLEGVPFVHVELRPADNASTALCDFARDHSVDLIVLGSHGRDGIARLLIGSVAEKTARHAECSVLVVR